MLVLSVSYCKTTTSAYEDSGLKVAKIEQPDSNLVDIGFCFLNGGNWKESGSKNLESCESIGRSFVFANPNNPTQVISEVLLNTNHIIGQSTGSERKILPLGMLALDLKFVHVWHANAGHSPLVHLRPLHSRNSQTIKDDQVKSANEIWQDHLAEDDCAFLVCRWQKNHASQNVG